VILFHGPTTLFLTVGKDRRDLKGKLDEKLEV
jgi:hypothetical protein